MKNKKGFTLIELLAVIIILAVIALITAPIVLNVVDEAKKSSFQDSAYGIIKAGEYYYTNQILSGGMTSDKTFNFPGDSELEFNGTKPKSGYITVTKEGKVKIAVSDGKYCATKGFNDDEITITEDDGECGKVAVAVTSFHWSAADVDIFEMALNESTYIKISDVDPNSIDLDELRIIGYDASTGNVTVSKFSEVETTYEDDKMIVINEYIFLILEDNYTYEGITFEEVGFYVNLKPIVAGEIEIYSTYVFDWSGNDVLPPTNIVIENMTDNSATLTSIEGAEYSIDGENWQDSSTFTGLIPSEEYYVYVRYKETSTTSASLMAAIGVRTGFVIDDSNSELIGYTKGITELIIPSKVTDENGNERTVVAITSLTTTIDSTLTSVIMPDSMVSIDSLAFLLCGGLTSVTLNDGLKTIGYGAFASAKLTSVEIPASVEKISGYAFSNVPEFVVNNNNQNYSSENGVLYNKNKTTLVSYPAGKTDTSFVIPSSVTTIGADAFGHCENLTNITIPNSVTSIGYMSFAGCENLTSVTISSSVKTIGSRAFEDCTNLTSITFEGTIAECYSISLGTDWNSNVPATKVICSDGEVNL